MNIALFDETTNGEQNFGHSCVPQDVELSTILSCALVVGALLRNS